MDIAEKTLQLKQDFDDVYEAGKSQERDDFWGVFQNYGEMLEGYDRLRYNFAFSYNKFDDNTYNPKYPIEVITNGSTLTNAFAGNTLIKDTKVPIKISTNNPAVDVILNNTFVDCSNLETIRELHFGDRAYINETGFMNCKALKNLTVTGIIFKSFNVQWCPLTDESIKSVVKALSDTTSGLTCTFKKTAKEAAFTTDEWNTLIATKPNWTFSLV